MSRCPTFVRTQFLGGGIIKYDARLGWSGQGGTGGNSELVVEVVNDTCGNRASVAYDNNGWGDSTIASTDDFNPPQLGYPVEFHFNTFRFGGLLRKWKESDSARGAKTYTIIVQDPSVVLESAQLILNNYTGQIFNCPNLYNIYGWLEENYGDSCPDFSGTFYPPYGFNVALRYDPALGFGGAWTGKNRHGLPWFQIRDALTSMTGGNASRFGGQLEYRGVRYYLDLSELPNLDTEIRFSNSGISLLEMITQVCELAQYDFFVELASEDTIKIRTADRSMNSSDGGAVNIDTGGSNPDSRLNAGTIGSAIGSVTEAVSKARGIELRDAYVNAFITGGYRRDLWQCAYTGGCFHTATIWPYWGKDENDNVIIGQGCATADMTSQHSFTIWIGDLGLPGLTTWTVDTNELRCAAKGTEAWLAYCLARDPRLERSLSMVSDFIIEDGGFIADRLNSGKAKANDFVAWGQRQAQLAVEFDDYEPLQALCRRVQQYAGLMGRQFMVRLPYLCKKIYADTPYQIESNWEKANGDSAWFEGSVLGLSPGSIALEMFRQADGQIVGFVGFQSTGAPLDFSGCQVGNYIQLNPYVGYVRCEVVEIVHNVGGDPTDSRVVIRLDSSVTLRNIAPVPEPLLLFYAMTRHRLPGISPAQLYQLALCASMDKIWHELPGLQIMPLAAAVPLESTVNCYGPWGAMVTDGETSNAGKTYYKSETAYVPWEFGSVSKLNLAGDVTARTQLTDKYVFETGEVQIADAPTTSLGEALYGGGTVVSGVNVNFGLGNGAVTTTYTLQLYSARYGRLGQQWVEAIRRNGQAVQAYRYEITQRRLKHFQQWLEKATSLWNYAYARRMLRFTGHSSSDFIVAENIPDPNDPTRSTSSVALGIGTQILPTLRARDDGEYRRKAGGELSQLFRPFTTREGGDSQLPGFENAGTPAWDDDYLLTNTRFYTKDQLPPIFCEEHHMPIVMETLSPFLKEGRSVNGGEMSFGSSEGHDIEYIVRDSTFPVHLNIRQGDYSTSHDYRGIGIRGPVIVAQWGFDIDNKPVPNASPSYPSNPKMAFADNWLQKPDTWKCGPLDVRWDYQRKVWTAPPPFKLVRLKLCGPLLPDECAHAIMWADELQYDKDGNYLPWQDCCSGPGGWMRGNAKVTVWSTSHRPVPEGFDIMATYDTYTEAYHMIYHDDPLYVIQILSPMYPGAWGLGVIVRVLATGADQCGRLVGQLVIVENPLGQPLCTGQYAVSYLTDMIPTTYEEWCDQSCPNEVWQSHIVLQASFRPLCVVTWVSLIECCDNAWKDVECELTGGGGACYCNYEISCEQILDEWVEYDVCVKDRVIYLQAAYSEEKAWEGECTPDQIPGGQAKGGSQNSVCAGRLMDCVGAFAPCYNQSEGCV